MSNLNQIKCTEVPARVAYIEGTINPASLYDAPPINLCVQIPVDFLTQRHKTKEDGFIRAVMFMAAAGPLKFGGGKNESDLNYVMRVYYGRNIKTDIERSLDIPVVSEMRGLFGFGDKYCYGFNTQEDVRTALNAVPSEYMTKAEKKACIRLYPSNKQLGIAPPPQMGFQFNARRCSVTRSLLWKIGRTQNTRLFRAHI